MTDSFYGDQLKIVALGFPEIDLLVLVRSLFGYGPGIFAFARVFVMSVNERRCRDRYALGAIYTC